MRIDRLQERALMEKAIQQMHECRQQAERAGAILQSPPAPYVGVVLADADGKEIKRAYRGEDGFTSPDHAEHLLFKKIETSGTHVPPGSLLFVTLEPCTARSPHETGCAFQILKQSAISRVYMGMPDPNPDITGAGYFTLHRQCEIEYFPADLATQIQEANKEFIKWFRPQISDGAHIFTIFKLRKDERIMVVSPTQDHKISILKGATRYEDAEALWHLSKHLQQYRVQHDPLLHGEITPLQRAQHLCLIGGLEANSVTKAIVEHPHSMLPYRFGRATDNGDLAILGTAGDRISGHMQPGVDYAIVAKIQNPWATPDRPTLIYLVAGLHALGTRGAARFMGEPLPRRVGDTCLYSELRARCRNNLQTMFAAVLKVENHAHGEPVTSVIDFRSCAMHEGRPNG